MRVLTDYLEVSHSNDSLIIVLPDIGKISIYDGTMRDIVSVKMGFTTTDMSVSIGDNL